LYNYPNEIIIVVENLETWYQRQRHPQKGLWIQPA
jgi:hypothetical protein